MWDTNKSDPYDAELEKAALNVQRVFRGMKVLICVYSTHGLGSEVGWLPRVAPDSGRFVLSCIETDLCN